MNIKKRNLLLLLLGLVILGRILLPYFLERYVNRVLNDIPGYTGYVEDIDVALYRGAYVIEGLHLDKINADVSTPFLMIPKTDISLEWKALFKGRIVSEIYLHDPVINYIYEDQKKGSPEGKPKVVDWRQALIDLVPIEINHFQINNGKFSYVEFSADPQIDLVMDHIVLSATNLRNVERAGGPLPSTIHATAVSFGGGSVLLTGKMDIMQKIPDLDLEFSLQKADVTALNDTFLKFAGVDFARGTFELYAEAAIADGYLKGYIKPMFIDTELIGKEDKGFFEKVWEGFVGVFKFLLKNQSTDTLATRTPFEGDLKNVDTGLTATILNIFKNAWFNAFTPQVEEDINYSDAKRASED
ncbi:DUF748 domain-containing protein [Salinimicrobium oceani]|uniref:DUF748 domain-containing protein n=1 Tax=Salinimicrobium oceani TaxID=2722702 RepID=A0ABX1CYV5_9FLAO|nr:DUF748 domain-containing protein [Salinimicrobium oceani]NJW51491.1 DUF748 domain-containing protein [Salinimicrobium oceani]